MNVTGFFYRILLPGFSDLPRARSSASKSAMLNAAVHNTVSAQLFLSITQQSKNLIFNKHSI